MELQRRNEKFDSIFRTYLGQRERQKDVIDAFDDDMFDEYCDIGCIDDGGANPPLGEFDSGIVTYGDPCGSFIDFSCLSFFPKIRPKVDFTPFFLAAA